MPARQFGSMDFDKEVGILRAGLLELILANEGRIQLYIRNGDQLVLATPSCGSLRDLYSKLFPDQEWIWFSRQYSDGAFPSPCWVKGAVSITPRGTPIQLFAVNRKPVDLPSLVKTVRQCVVRQYGCKEKHVCVLIHVECSIDQVDFTADPAKREAILKNYDVLVGWIVQSVRNATLRHLGVCSSELKTVPAAVECGTEGRDRHVPARTHFLGHVGKVSQPEPIKYFDFHSILHAGFQGLHESTCQLNRDDVARIHLLGSIEDKFLVGVVHRDDAWILLLLDQHAVDERIRLELIWRDFFDSDGPCWQAPSMVLDRPIAWSNQSDIVHGSFELWGFRVISRHGHCMEIQAVPSVLAGRHFEESWIRDLLDNVLDEEADQIDNYLSLINESIAQDRFRKCPRCLLDCMATKACKSAFKFGDRLTMEQCVQMVNRLSECDYPFQCAHGRPTMIPLFARCAD